MIKNKLLSGLLIGFLAFAGISTFLSPQETYFQEMSPSGTALAANTDSSTGIYLQESTDVSYGFVDYSNKEPIDVSKYAYVKIEPSGCGEYHGNVMIRYDFFLTPKAHRYYDRHLYVVDETCPIFKAGYKGAIDKDGKAINQSNYKAWVATCRHIWVDAPFHSHFCYFDTDVTDAEIEKAGLYHLGNFYSAWLDNWIDSQGGMRHGWDTETRVRPVRYDEVEILADYELRKDDVETRVEEVKTLGISDSVGTLIGEGETFPSTDIDIGPGAIDRASWWTGTWTFVDLNNPANDTGRLDTFELWAVTGNDMGGTKVGTFSGSGTSYNDRDYETIGTVTAGSKQSFTGLDCDVVTGDFIGTYFATGQLEYDTEGFAGLYYDGGDNFGAGVKTYTSLPGDAISLYGTGETPVAPTVTTQAVDDIDTTTATGNGNITDTGGENNDHRGFVWDEATHSDPGDVSPAVSDYADSVDEAGSFGTGAFTGNLTGLDPGTLYYVRAYAHNTTGYSYGGEVSFTTLATPTVTTQAASSIEETTATLNGNITAEGDTTPTIRGFEYDTDSGAPYTNDWNEVGSWGVGAYTHGLTGLTKGELYYYRAYATNTIDTGYGAEEKFLTKPDEPTGLTATNPSSGTVTLVWVKGTGAQDTVVRGKDGSYPANVADGYEVYNGAGTTDNDTGLTGGHTYYYRAWSYATEGGESQYSDTYSQDNQYVIALPTTTTQAVGYTGMTIVTFNGNITATGGENNDYRGFAWGTASHGDPGNIAPAASAYTSYWPDAGSFGTGAFIYEDAVLIAGTTYYVRSYTHNSMGWSYGAEVSFGTLGQELWWQPATMVISNAVDRTGNGNHGTINWGENPLGVETSVGGISSSGDFTPPGEEGEDFDILPIPSGWNVTATNTTGVTGFWLYDLVNRAAESLGFTAQTMYVIIGLIAATGVGFGALIGTGNMLGFAIGFGATAGLFAATGVMPWWIIIVIVAIVGMGIYTWRRG